MVEVVDDRGHRQALLQRAARPGRTREAALHVLGRVRANPKAPGAALGGGLRKARHLHSNERRLVGDGIREVLRHQAVLDRVLGVNDDEARWLGWLVARGLAPESARAERPDLPFDAVVDLDAAAEAATADLDPVEAVAVAGNLHKALARELVDSLGPDGAHAFLKASNDRAPVGLRVNVAVAGMDEARRALTEAGIATTPMSLAPHGLEVVGRANVVGSRPYRDGVVEIQDEGSQVLAAVVDPDGGPMVDFCAGAGGKTLALAAAAPQAPILATDVRKGALDELYRRARRADVHRLEVQALDPDGQVPFEVLTWTGRASRVLVDAPCSGTGTLRRRPETRLRLDGSVLAELPPLQAEILDRAAELVRPGGRLVYATCSVLEAENDGVVQAFLEERDDYRALPLSEVVGPERARRVGDGQVLRLAPHTHGTDGFFGAVLERTG